MSLILHTNIRSVLNKDDYLSCIVASCSADVIALTEPWLKNDVSDVGTLVGALDYSVYCLHNAAYRLLLFGRNIRLLNVTLNTFRFH